MYCFQVELQKKITQKMSEKMETEANVSNGSGTGYEKEESNLR